MRSSKSRSRSKTNRPRTLGNIINRVFDSSGPEGKVRGTPQQIIEKYQMLARDAQLSNDRVAAENFSQHAEHYTRMLAEATREMAAEQEARQQQFQQNGGNGGQNGNQNAQNSGQGGQNQNRNDRQGEYRQGEYRERDRDRSDRPERAEYRTEYRTEARDLGSEDQPAAVEVIDHGAVDDTGLIETPEARNRPRPPVATPEDAAPREDRPQGNRRARGPRKPKPEAAPGGSDTPPKEAAE